MLTYNFGAIDPGELEHEQADAVRQRAVGAAAPGFAQADGEAARAIRDKANLVLTNPDMLNSSFLPNHGLRGFAHIFRNLRYVVAGAEKVAGTPTLDEAEHQPPDHAQGEPVEDEGEGRPRRREERRPQPYRLGRTAAIRFPTSRPITIPFASRQPFNATPAICR